MFDPNNNPYNDPADSFHRSPRQTASPMIRAAVSCAIIAIVTLLTGFFSIIFGSLAVLFAALSKGSKNRLERPAKYAFGAGLIAILISIVMICYSLFSIMNQYGSFMNYYNSVIYTMEQYYNMDIDGDGNIGPAADLSGTEEVL